MWEGCVQYHRQCCLCCTICSVWGLMRVGCRCRAGLDSICMQVGMLVHQFRAVLLVDCMLDLLAVPLYSTHVQYTAVPQAADRGQEMGHTR